MGKGDGWGEGGNSWAHGTLGCLTNPINCLCGTFCWPCLLCQNANKLDESGCLCWIAACFVPCVPLTILRTKTRERYDIDGGVCNDAMCSFCCGPCTNCQLANELDHHGA